MRARETFLGILMCGSGSFVELIGGQSIRNDSLFVDIDTKNLVFLVYTNDAVGCVVVDSDKNSLLKYGSRRHRHRIRDNKSVDDPRF